MKDCRLERQLPQEIEHFIMKAPILGLLRGTIDLVAEIVKIEIRI